MQPKEGDTVYIVGKISRVHPKDVYTKRDSVRVTTSLNEQEDYFLIYTDQITLIEPADTKCAD